MAETAQRPVTHDPAVRGHDGRQLPPVDPPAPGAAPSPAWLAQLGRAPIGEYADGREVVKRLVDNGLAVPGDDPLYQYLGAHRVFVEVLQAQHDDQLGRMGAMLDEARQALAQLLTDVGKAGGAALAARRAEDEGALKRLSAELDQRIAEGTRMMRQAMAEERDATTGAITVAVAEALARVDRKPGRSVPGGLGRLLGIIGTSSGQRGRSVAAWAGLLAASVFAGLVLLWVFGHGGVERGHH